MTETSPESLLALQHRLQRVVTATTATHRGRRPTDVVAALQQALVDARLPDQPGPWMRASAAEIAAGRQVVLNTFEAPDELDDLAPDPDQHAAG